MKLLIAIAVGGALGALGRHFATGAVASAMGGGFPFGVLTVNVVGSLVLGVLIELSALVWSPGAELRAFLVVGVLGAFTTFSTFALDTVLLLQRGEVLKALVYIVASVVASVLALYLGMLTVKAAVG